MEEIRWLQAEAIVSIATKHGIPISKAPSMVTVITAEQIKQMGFRTLMDVLKIVPGFDISLEANGVKEIAARGILDDISYKVKLLIDGHSVNTPWNGGAMWSFYDLVVGNAKKIEIIRGPGSALYGQNAFLAVINVVTKDSEDIDGVQLTAAGGSFDTQNYNILLGKELGDLKISGFLDYLKTEGHSETVEQDILFPAPFSKSPGRTQNEREKTDLNLKLSYKDLEFMSKYMKKRREGYIGVDFALNDETDIRDTYIFSELTYQLALSDKIKMIPKVYYDQYNSDSIFESRPDGFAVTVNHPVFGPVPIVYPDGIQGKFRFKQRTICFENQMNYDVFEGNRLTLGLQYEWIHQGDIKLQGSSINPRTLAPLPSRQDFTGTFLPARRATRHIYAFYLQDEWSITDHIDLTVGVRHDRFTRFEGTTNPRLGLVWRFKENAHLKLLFATAFRAPSFQEMFINTPVRKGNSGLDPEKINTFEAGLAIILPETLRVT